MLTNPAHDAEACLQALVRDKSWWKQFVARKMLHKIRFMIKVSMGIYRRPLALGSLYGIAFELFDVFATHVANLSGLPVLVIKEVCLKLLSKSVK